MDSRSSSSQPPNGARARYLGGLSPEKQVEVLLKAERLGPAPNDDADWLVAQAASDAAKRIDEAAKRIEASIGPTPDAAVVARLDRIEALVRRGATAAGEPIVSEPVRYLVAFAGGVLLCLALAVLAINERIAPSFVTLTAAFGLGLGCALAYSYIAPIIRDMRR